MAKMIAFESEYALHKLTQKHLKELFDLEFVASEIQLNDLRLDNLAFDRKTNSFVIIEYKNEFNANVLNQAREYHDLVLENKEFFSKRLENPEKISFENTKVMIVGPKFSTAQIKESYFEIWRISLFDDGKVTYENLKTDEIKTLNINLDELKLTEEMLLENKSEKMKEMYFNLMNILSDEFNDLEIKFLVDQFSLRVNDNLICLIRFLKSSFAVYIYAENLKNADKTVDISSKATAGNANYQLKCKSDDDLDYFIGLFKQAYNQKKV